MIIQYVLCVSLLSSITATAPKASASVDEQHKDSCIYCHAIATTASLVEGGTAEQEEIEEQIRELCSTLSPHSFECLLKSRKLTPFVIDAMAIGNKASDVCNRLSNIDCQKVVAAGTSTGLPCRFCKVMEHILEKQFAGHTTELRELAKSVCNSTRLNRGGKFCDYLLGAHHLDLSILSKAWNRMCTGLLLCKADKAIRGAPISMFDISENITCTVCHVAMELLQLALKELRFEANTLSLLQSLCSYLPAEVHQDCSDFVKTNVQELVEKMIEYLGPDHICTVAHYCPATTAKLQHNIY
uniref:Saposin B-type domain-containing protein n=1 Tax=Trichuris muris TaxID=70415 RepID=A0A5S6QXV1_TRIMR